MANPTQLYVAGLPIFTQSDHLDALSFNVNVVSPAVGRRQLDGSFTVQRVASWKKRRIEISGRGLPGVGFKQYLMSDCSFITSEETISGVIVEVSGPSRDVWGAEDNWTVVVEET